MPTPMISAITVKPWARIRALIMYCDIWDRPWRKFHNPNPSAVSVAAHPIGTSGFSLILRFIFSLVVSACTPEKSFRICIQSNSSVDRSADAAAAGAIVAAGPSALLTRFV
uniref:Uncharacterized protein n=1 Tax=Anopheles christyi TaxID=43041 RepID=A0A182KIY2_9DIPT